MRRLLTPRWIAFTVVVVVLAGVFVQLGRWQLHRLDDRHQRNAIIRTNIAAEPASLGAALGGADKVERSNEWRRVSLSGRYDPAHQIVIRYRNVKDRPGFEIVTPLLLADGSAILVDRGFVQRDRNSSEVPSDVPAPTAGEVTVTGRLRHSENGEPEATDAADGHARLINAPAIATATGLKLADGYVTLDEQNPPPAEGLTSLPLPEIDSGPHFFYALQWFFFALLAVGGLLYFARDEVRGDRRRVARVPAEERGLPADR